MDVMEEFRQKFIEEAEELITRLEHSLLVLEKDPGDETHVEQVFRCMHTLKGNGGMFGYSIISEFTHSIEEIYDYVRRGRLKVNRNLLDLTLRAVDHLKLLLGQDNELDEKTAAKHKEISRDIENIIHPSLKNETDQPSKSRFEPLNHRTRFRDLNENTAGTFYVLFKPNEDFFDNGTNPLYLLDDLHHLGTAAVVAHPDDIPDINKFDTEKCYTWWELMIATDQNINGLREVFIFVEDDSRIEIIKLSDQNLFENEEFSAHVEKLSASGNRVDLKAIYDIIDGTPEAPAAMQHPFRHVPVQTATVTKTIRPKPRNSIPSIRVSSGKVDTLMNLISELVTVQSRLMMFAENAGNPNLMSIAEQVQKLSKELRDNAFSISLVPLSSITTNFERLVRDLSNELGKKIRLSIEGESTELDKTIVEHLSDPLMHILRNSIDHGIESPALREGSGKPIEGTISLKAYHSGSNVIIEVRDDGAGMDTEKILKKAREKRLVTDIEELTRQQIFDLVFLPGFSTSNTVSGISGRGVGMDVVARTINELRGEVFIDSGSGAGTTVSIVLPITLSIIDGMQVVIDDVSYIVPLAAVHKIYAIEHRTIEKAFDNVIVLEGKQIPFFYLREQFGILNSPPEHEEVLVVTFENHKVGLVIDKVVGEFQTVIKPLGRHYKKQEFLSGGTILGDGNIALVLDTNKIITRFTKKDFIKEESK